MLLQDTWSLRHGTEVRADLCIIGAGAAGITIARALKDSPRRTRVRSNGVRARTLEATDLAGRPQLGIASQPGGDGSTALALRACQLLALRAR